MSEEKDVDNISENLSSLTVDNTDLSVESDANKTEKLKIDILLKPTGNAPIMKKKKWAVDADKPLGWVMEFMQKYMKLEPQERIFLYVNQTFAPSPDQTVRNIYDCFSIEGKLVLHYSKQQAWG